jgi:branched-chain amino acid transport system substrate-binding protein
MRPLLGCLLVGAALLVACGGDDDDNTAAGGGDTAASTSGSNGDLVIGLATAHSGFQAPIDAPAEAAAKLAAADFNKKGGILGRQIKFIQADTKSDPAQAANAGVEMLDKGADVLVVTCDYDMGGPPARVANKKNVLAISLCASSPKWNEIGPLSYSMTYGSPTEGAVAAEWAAEGRIGCKNGFLLTDTLIDYTKQIGEAIKRHFPGKLVGDQTFKNTDTSFSSQINAVRSANPDCIFLPTIAPGGVTLLRQMRAAGIDAPVISDEALNGEFWIDAIPNLSDFYLTGYASHYGDDPEPEVNDIADRLSQQSGKPLSGGTFVSGYSVMQALKTAMEGADSADTDKVVAQLQSFDGEPLLQGPTTFTKEDRQSFGRPMRIIQVQNGKFSYLETFKPTDCTTNDC